jgi:transposase
VVTIGVDAHKRSHTLVAVDALGRILDTLVVGTGASEYAKAVTWAREQYGAELTWGIEDARHVSGGFERALLSANESVIRVPTRLMKNTRASARTVGKSDPIDAAAVARSVLREPNLPKATPDGPSRDVKLLVDRREDLVDQRTATVNRLLWRIHELDPEREPKQRAFLFAVNRRALAEWLGHQPGLVAELASDELADIDRLVETTKQLERRINELVRALAPSLLTLPGCGELTAAKIVGETAGVGRFKNDAGFARFAGVAPVPSWSANTGTVRSIKTGNRRVNSALHRIALTQLRLDCEGQQYYRKRREMGDSPAKAIRCLKRRLARVVFQRLRADDTESERPVSSGLREILDAVVADPGADHSIAAMAERAAVSERHLVDMFRVEVGMTPPRFVEQARLEAAKVLLATGDHGHAAVARRAGFGSADTMRRTFRRALGVSPSMYRSRFHTTGIHQSV